MQVGSSKRDHSVPPDFQMEESMLAAGAVGDHEPPAPPPPLPSPFGAPEAAASTIVRIAQYMAQAKKATKRLQVTPDEAMDRMLADHDRRAAKKKKQVTPDEAMDLLLEHDRRKAAKKKKVSPDEALDMLAENDRKKAKMTVGHGTLLAIQDEREETPAGARWPRKPQRSRHLP